MKLPKRRPIAAREASFTREKKPRNHSECSASIRGWFRKDKPTCVVSLAGSLQAMVEMLKSTGMPNFCKAVVTLSSPGSLDC